MKVKGILLRVGSLATVAKGLEKDWQKWKSEKDSWLYRHNIIEIGYIINESSGNLRLYSRSNSKEEPPTNADEKKLVRSAIKNNS